jgi:hypothetical protein
MKKFLSINPDAQMIYQNCLRLEWNGSKEYRNCSIMFGNDGIIFEAHSKDDAHKTEFGFGDLDAWKDAIEFIVGKCK